MIDLLGQFDHPLLLASRDAAVLALGIGLILLIFGRRMSPLWRHRLWLLVALRLLLPVLPTSPISWKAFLPSESAQLVSEAESVLPNQAENVVSLEEGKVEKLSDVYVDESLVLSSGVERAEQEFGVVDQSSAPQDLQQGAKWSLGKILLVTWAVGFASLFIFIGIVTWRFHRRLRCLTLAAHPRFTEIRLLLEGICRETGFRRVPKLRITEAIHSPALTGLIRPEILLPPRAVEALTAAELRLVLLHELGHLHRRDVWVNWLMSLLQALHWFNPLLWWAFHRTRIESERATDAWVLQHSGVEQAESYGQTLIQLLKSSTAVSIAPGVVAVVESRRDLRSRIRAIGSFSGKRNRWATWCAGALLLTVAAVGLTQAPDEGEGIKGIEETRDSDLIEILVTDSEGEPIFEAKVYAFSPADKFNSFEIVESLITNDKGSVSFVNKKESDGYLFMAYTEDQGVGGGRFMVNESKSNIPNSVVIKTGATADLPLRVVDLKGEPVPRLKLHVAQLVGEPNFFHAMPEMPAGIWSEVTNDEGRCIIKNVPADCRIYVDHKDSRFAQVAGVLNPMLFWHVVTGREVTIQLQQGKTVTGNVVFPDGRPLSGVRVRMREKEVVGNTEDFDICISGAITDKNGDFSIQHLRAGTYDVVIDVPESVRNNWADFKMPDFIIAEKPTHSELNITLRKGVVISGQVTSDVEGVSLEGIKVMVNGRGGMPTQQRDSRTDSAGRFSLRVAEGWHAFSVEQSGPDFASLEGDDWVFEVKKRDRRTIRFHFLDPNKDSRVVSGRVVDENGEAVFAQLLSAEYEGEDGAGFWRLDGAQTDATGKFSVKIPKNVKYPFLYARGNLGAFENPDWWSMEKVYSQMIRVESGKEVLLKLLPRKDLATIRGRLVDKDGRGMIGKSIMLNFADYGTDLHVGFIITGQNGAFEISDLVPGVGYKISSFNGKNQIPLVQKENIGSAKFQTKSGETLDLGEMILKVVENNKPTNQAQAHSPKKNNNSSPTPLRRQIFITSKFIDIDSKDIELPFELSGHVVLSNKAYQAFIKELGKQSGVDILSNPTLMAWENQRAKTEILRKYPISADDSKGGGESVDAGLTLDLSAKIEGDGIRLKGRALIRELDQIPAVSDDDERAVAAFAGSISFNTVESFFDKVIGQNEVLILQCKRSEKQKGRILVAISAQGEGKGWPRPKTAESASEVANVEVRQKFQIKPLVPADFKKTVVNGNVVFTAVTAIEMDDLRVRVIFNVESIPKVRLSILTGRVIPQAIKIKADGGSELPHKIELDRGGNVKVN